LLTYFFAAVLVSACLMAMTATHLHVLFASHLPFG
jgi:hypothetical protein